MMPVILEDNHVSDEEATQLLGNDGAGILVESGEHSLIAGVKDMIDRGDCTADDRARSLINDAVAKGPDSRFDMSIQNAGKVATFGAIVGGVVGAFTLSPPVFLLSTGAGAATGAAAGLIAGLFED